MVITKKVMIIFAIFILTFSVIAEGVEELNFGKKTSAKFSYNFGQVKEKEIVSHTFKILNNSQFPWQIEKISTSCGCVTAKLIGKRMKDKQIAPQEILKVRVDIDTNGHKGSLDQFVYVNINQEDKKKILKLVMEGVVTEKKRTLKQLIEKANFLELNEQATDFTLSDLNGKKVSLSDYKGKVVLLNFWTTWCPNCVRERPYLEKLHKKFKDDDFILIGVNVKQIKRKVDRFVKKHNLSFLNLIDEDGKVSDKYRVFSIPTSFIINKEGKIIAKAFGLRRWSDEEEIIDLFKYLVKK